MIKAPLPINESDRLAALRKYDILDSEPEAAFNSVVQLASYICQTPIAAISLVDEKFYHDLKLYRATPSAQAKGSLKARFDRIFSRSFGFDDLDQALVRLKARKSELLVVLDRPEVPLNTNISEQEIRDPVTLRKISGGTHSEDGRRCRDTFLSLKKTCQKNAISFWAYLGDRLGIAANTVARLPDIIRARAAQAPA